MKLSYHQIYSHFHIPSKINTSDTAKRITQHTKHLHCFSVIWHFFVPLAAASRHRLTVPSSLPLAVSSFMLFNPIGCGSPCDFAYEWPQGCSVRHCIVILSTKITWLSTTNLIKQHWRWMSLRAKRWWNMVLIREQKGDRTWSWEELHILPRTVENCQK